MGEKCPFLSESMDFLADFLVDAVGIIELCHGILLIFYFINYLKI